MGPAESAANAAKHGVTFDDEQANSITTTLERQARPAVTVFLDANALDGPDLAHSATEARFVRLGRAIDGRVLMVAYTVRRRDDAETVRLISARRASRRERAAYRAKD